MATFTVRPDVPMEDAIAYAIDQTGQTRARVIRQAVLDYEWTLRREALRQESLALRENPADRAEALAILEDMGSL
ncbi:MAG: hypothetical protein FWD29_05875 [Micrococcales bacterium]|nr:hypothetical protein [Micrococcales bacterium]